MTHPTFGLVISPDANVSTTSVAVATAAAGSGGGGRGGGADAVAELAVAVQGHAVHLDCGQCPNASQQYQYK